MSAYFNAVRGYTSGDIYLMSGDQQKKAIEINKQIAKERAAKSPAEEQVPQNVAPPTDS